MEKDRILVAEFASTAYSETPDERASPVAGNRPVP